MINKIFTTFVIQYIYENMKAIIAKNNLSFIGLDNRLLCECKEDLKLFKKLTLNSSCLVGYNTFINLPKLKNREIIVDEVGFYKQADWCIGGKKTYEKYCHLFTELHISVINNNSIGDVLFPDLKSLKKECKIFIYNFN